MALVRTSLFTGQQRSGNTQSSGSVATVAGVGITVRVGYLNGGGAPGTNSIADTAGNTWTKQAEYGVGQAGATIFSCIANATGSTTITITNSNGGGVDIAFGTAIDSWSGIHGTTPFGSTADNSAGSHDVNPPNDLTITLGAAPASGDYTIGALGAREFSAMSGTAASGWTVDFTGRETTGGAVILFYQHQIRTGSTSTSVVFDLVGGDEFEECGVALVVKAAPATAATPMGWVARNARRIPVKVAKSSLYVALAPSRRIPYNPPVLANRRRIPVRKAPSALDIVVTPARRVFPPAFIIANRRRVPVPKPKPSVIIGLAPSPPPTVTPALPWVAKNRTRIPVARARSVYATTYEPAQQTAFVWVARNVTRIPVRKPKPALVVVLPPAATAAMGWVVTNRRRVPVGRPRPALKVVFAPTPTVTVVGAFAFTLRNRRRTPVGKPRSAIRSGFYATPVVVIVITGRCWGWVEVESGNDSILGGTMPGGWIELEPAASEASGQTSYGYVEMDTTSEGEIVV